MTDQYDKVLSNLIELHAPVRTRTVTLRPYSPWYDDNLRSLKRAKRQAERKYVKSGLEVHRQIFEDQCPIYSDALNSAKQEYYKNQISGSDQRQLFRMIDGLFKVKSAPLLPTCDSPQGLSEKFATFFSGKIVNLKDSLHSSVLATMDLSVTPSQPLCQTTFCDFSAVSVHYISELLVKSNTKSCILDPAPTSVLKHSIEALAPAITSIVNASLLSGVFPSSLKKGVIHPSIKKLSLDREAYPSYRPITNVAFLSKMLERVAATQTLNYLIPNGLLAKFQSAYRCFHSTETTLLRVFNDILVAIDNHRDVVLVLLDLSAAFDTIEHSVLLSRLEHRYGFDGKVLNWFRSYLIGRSQQVLIADVRSADYPLQYGVPQGSVLGPFLFSLFFAPLENVVQAHGFNVMTYADDTQLYVSLGSSDDRPAVLSKFEACVKDILIWCTSNGLACNPDKTEVIHLRSCFHSITLPDIDVGGYTISPTPAARDLGVLVDSHLTLSKHVNSVCILFH